MRMVYTRPVSALLTEEEYQKLQKALGWSGRRKSELIRALLVRWIDVNFHGAGH